MADLGPKPTLLLPGLVVLPVLHVQGLDWPDLCSWVVNGQQAGYSGESHWPERNVGALENVSHTVPSQAGT